MLFPRFVNKLRVNFNHSGLRKKKGVNKKILLNKKKEILEERKG